MSSRESRLDVLVALEIWVCFESGGKCELNAVNDRVGNSFVHIVPYTNINHSTIDIPLWIGNGKISPSCEQIPAFIPMNLDHHLLSLAFTYIHSSNSTYLRSTLTRLELNIHLCGGG